MSADAAAAGLFDRGFGDFDLGFGDISRLRCGVRPI
jgi:hypothetical protein